MTEDQSVKQVIVDNTKAMNDLRAELHAWRTTSIPLTAVRWMFLIVVLTVGGLRAVDKFLPATVIESVKAESVDE